MGKGRKIWGGRVAGGPPIGEPFLWKTLELISSDAWRFRSMHCARLLDFLEVEHLRHGGVENGSLVAPYSQLETHIGRRFINKAIAEAEARKLIEVKRGGLKGRAMTDLNRFRLTYCWTKIQVNGLWDWNLPTDDWKTYEEPKPGVISAPSAPSTVHHRTLASVHHRTLPPGQAVEIAEAAAVHLCTLPSISWGGEQITASVSTSPAQRGRSAPPKSAVASPRVLPSSKSSRLNGSQPGKSAA